MTIDHTDHDLWPLISEPGTIWCRTCQVHFRKTHLHLDADPEAVLDLVRPRLTAVVVSDIEVHSTTPVTHRVTTRMGKTVVVHEHLLPADYDALLRNPTLAHRREWVTALTNRKQARS